MTTTDVSPTHHSVEVDEVVRRLRTDSQRGLSQDQAARLLVEHGSNTLPATAGAGLVRRVLRQFHHPLIYVLLVAAAVTFALDEVVDSAVILGVVLVNALVGLLQESKAEQALDALRSMVRTSARVVRDGAEATVDASEVVPGDLVVVDAGDKVPADLRLVREAELAVDESALTGESLPSEKDEVVLPHHTTVADRRNMLYSGTLVTAGSGAGIAVATGAQTQLGEIHRLVGSADTLATPLTRKLAAFSTLLTVWILGLAAFTFVLGLLRGRPVDEMVTASVALAVGAIPEGLPAAVTITLAIGVSRMARRRAVVRRLPAVETLGSTTVVCSDKTGTLTQNQMTVRTVWTPDRAFTVSGSGYAPDGQVHGADGEAVSPTVDQALRWSLTVGVGCNDATLVLDEDEHGIVGDPTEGALLAVAAKAGIHAEDLALSLRRVATTPFSSERQYMATVHRDREDGDHVALVKGAAERVIAMCVSELGADGDVRPVDRAAALRVTEQLAADGLRVLGTAYARVDGAEAVGEQALEGRLILTGLQAMLDPPREAAAGAVQTFHTAGITVKMITGDHASTATAIAGQLGLLHDPVGPHDVLTGEELEALPDADYPDAVERASVFARVSPAQKLRLVKAMQARRHVIAMTGDGVNDAPALRQADIGIAMGHSGTEVAKEAADMVLTDDDFATIEAAVEEGRGVFDNLTKFIVWTLPTNVGEGMIVLVAILLGRQLPILPTQILWINMTTAVLLGLMLAFEPKEADVMTRPPRDPDRPLLTRALVVRVLLVSALVVAGSLWVFEAELGSGASLPEARTAAVNAVVAIQILYLFSCRSLSRAAWRLGLLSNPWVIGGVCLQILAQLCFTYVPALNDLFQTAPIGTGAWSRILLAATVASLVIAVDKRFRHAIL